ncbi:MAG: hypothetical protein WBF33_09460 [Candidatus Nitrosopolaris sp.]
MQQQHARANGVTSNQASRLQRSTKQARILSIGFSKDNRFIEIIGTQMTP